MLIECHLFDEKDPHIIDLHGDTYKFTRNEAGDLVCDIMHKEHQERLLVEISEAYRVYGVEARAEYEAMLAQRALNEMSAAEQEAKVKLETAQLNVMEAQKESEKRRDDTAKGASLDAKRKRAAKDAALEAAVKKEVDKAELRKQG